MEFPWMDLLKNFGPMVGLIVFFIWRDWQRETMLNTRIENLEKYQREVLESLVTKATTALTQTSDGLKWIGHVVDRLSRVCPRMVGQECDKPEGLKV